MVKPRVNPPVKHRCRALVSGWIAGRRVQAGDEIELSAAQARYEKVEPLTADPQAEAAEDTCSAPVAPVPVKRRGKVAGADS